MLKTDANFITKVKADRAMLTVLIAHSLMTDYCQVAALTFHTVEIFLKSITSFL